MFPSDIELRAGEGALKWEKYHPPPNLKKKKKKVSKSQPLQGNHIWVFLLFALLYLWRGGVGGVGDTRWAWLLSFWQGCNGAGLWTSALGSPTPQGRIYRHCCRRAQRAELCAHTSWEEAANLQIPAHTRRLPSAHKLLIKLVHLIMGRTIKYVSRCFRSSLWVLVKAAEASDQGCWLCSAAAWSPLSWTLGLPSTAQSAGTHLLRRLVKAQSIITKVKKTFL